MTDCTKCNNKRYAKTIEIHIQCRACMPALDRITFLGIEFSRNDKSSLVINGPNDAVIASPAMARELATFLIQNFCAPEDYS